MQTCGNCGKESWRVRTTFNAKGEPRDVCPQCSPESFPQEAITDPSDQKIWPGHEAMPHMYKMGGDGVLRAKDELIADTAALWDAGPTEQNRRAKRASRRTEPLTEAEIEKAQRWGNECLKPIYLKSQQS